ncbi:MAG: hypothetical protein LUD29_02090 [Clostridia bacterium]|nr:hypothetical protein [Clostridia bacterium]
MVGLIRGDRGGVYASHILALYEKGRKKEVVAFTEDFRAVKRFPVWRVKRRVYILDGRLPEERRSRWTGYPVIISDEALLKRVKKHPEPVEALGEEVKNLAMPPFVAEWHDIRKQSDLYYLTSLSGNFYKAKIEWGAHGEKIVFALRCPGAGLVTIEMSDISHDSVFKGKAALTEEELTKIKAPEIDLFFTESGQILLALGERCVQCEKLRWKIDAEE